MDNSEGGNENTPKRVTQVDIVPGAVKQRHIEALIIFTGVLANLPDGSTEVKAFFATDTNDLYIWNGASWVSTTLS